MSQNFDLPPPPQPPPQSSLSFTNQSELRLLDYGPIQGYAGDSFHISISNPSHVDPNLFKIAFDTCITTCHFSVNTVTQVLTIHAIVPDCESTKVPVYLVFEESEQQILRTWFISTFTFYSRKRSSIDQISPISSNMNDSKRLRQLEQPLYQPNFYNAYVGLPPTQPSPRSREYYDAERSIIGYPSETFQQQFNDGSYISNTTTSQSTQQGFDLMDPILTNQSSTAPSIQMKPLPLPLQTTNTSNTANLNPNSTPTTSTTNIINTPNTTNYPQPSPTQQQQQLQQQGQSTMPTLNPFAHLVNKANLIIEGDLQDMVKDWTQDEWESQRRLVRFWRRQEGNEVTCKFERFQLPSEKSKLVDTSKIIVVSCIYWKEKNDYFITSVDCIYLLEHLIGVKFTVEEKNRIRRNLEGYKPLTVSKLKPESAEFFKLIMGFPNPKPRNIEKDVKVFPWSILGVALKKIISKYTASYSSTASVNYNVLSNETTNL